MNRKHNNAIVRKLLRTMKFSDYGLALTKFITLVPFASLFFMPIFNRLGWDTINEAPGFYVALVGLLIAGSSFWTQIKPWEFVLFLLLAFVVYISPSFYPLSEAFVKDNYVSFVWMTVPFYFIGRCINYGRDKLILVIISRIGFVLFLLYELLATMGYFALSQEEVDFTNEQMAIAYDFLFCVMYELIYGLSEKSRIDCWISFIGILLILFMGARGPVVTLLLFIIGFFIAFYNYKSFKHLKRILVLLICGVFYAFMNPLLLGFSAISKSIGLSDRVFESIVANTLFESNGRDEIFSDLRDAISADLTGFGYGLGGDRLFTSHVYSHNFELEILVSFGVVLGGAFLCLLAILFIRAIIKTKGTVTCAFWFGLFCYGFVSLQFSGTWVNSPELFVLIGYSVSVLKAKEV